MSCYACHAAMLLMLPPAAITFGAAAAMLTSHTLIAAAAMPARQALRERHAQRVLERCHMPEAKCSRCCRFTTDTPLLDCHDADTLICFVAAMLRHATMLLLICYALLIYAVMPPLMLFTLMMLPLKSCCHAASFRCRLMLPCRAAYVIRRHSSAALPLYAFQPIFALLLILFSLSASRLLLLMLPLRLAC